MDTLKHVMQMLGPHGGRLDVVSQIILRLIVASILGGIIGIERELKHKAAGLRTQMFICFGAAFFTILSEQLASVYGGDHTRIAAQIIPGIGFIGAGSILHARGAVSGLTTAATLFVVASIGMAVGGGLLLPAVFATVVILMGLLVLGWMEGRFNLKPLTIAYEVTAESAEDAISTVNRVLERENRTMKTVELSRTDHTSRLVFTVEGSQRDHDALMLELRQAGALKRIVALGSADRE